MATSDNICHSHYNQLHLLYLVSPDLCAMQYPLAQGAGQVVHQAFVLHTAAEAGTAIIINIPAIYLPWIPALHVAKLIFHHTMNC